METPDANPYGELLRDAIAAGGSSRRKLSYELAAHTGNDQTSEYRSLGKYLNGAEVPTQERAAILAVLLSKPELALVEPRGRRRNRQEELEAEVARLREQLHSFAEGVAGRLAALEASQGIETPQSERRETGDRGGAAG